jgi:hypothetical protein
MPPTPTKSKRPPVTVVFDPPDLDEPDNVNVSEPSMDDFAAINPAIKPPKPKSASKAVTKRETVDASLQRLRDELNRNASFLGLVVCAKDAWTGQLILMNKEKQIDNWIEVARINPTIRNAMLAAMDMGVYATAITGSLALVIAALAHTQMLPNSDMLMTSVSGAGVAVPSDIQVAQTEEMFSGVKATYVPGGNGSVAS